MIRTLYCSRYICETRKRLFLVLEIQ